VRFPQLRAPTKWFLAALVATALAYAPSLNGDFQFDDLTSIEQNLSIRQVGRALSGVGPMDLLGPARPVTNVVLSIGWALAGAKPWPFRALSLLTHLATVTFAFLLLRSVLRVGVGTAAADLLGAGAAVVFALHPLQAEAVAYPAQLAEILAAALGLAAMCALWRSEGSEGRGAGLGWVALALLAHLLAMGAKTTAVVVPAAWIVLRVAVSARSAPELRARLPNALLRSLPLWMASAASVAANLWTLGPGETAGLHAGPGPWSYGLTEASVHWTYLQLVILPAGLTVDHAWRPVSTLADVRTLVSLAGICTVLGLSVAALLAERPAQRLGGAGILWWFVSLAPTSSVIPLDDPIAEHRVYVALLGLGLAAAAALWAVVDRTPERWRTSAIGTLSLTLLVLLGCATGARALVWSNDAALWTEALERNPSSARAMGNLAFALARRGRRDEAVSLYRRAQVGASPRIAANVALNLSAEYLDAGDHQRALDEADRGLAAGAASLDVLGLWHNRATALRLLGRHLESAQAARQGLALSPGYPPMLDDEGLALVGAGDLETALSRFRSAREGDPTRAEYWIHEASVLTDLGRVMEACAAWGRARGLEPLPREFGIVAEDLGCWR
jgi:protein O-mannosyl-transferase